MPEFLRVILNLPPAVTAQAARIDGLHFFVIGVTMLGSSVVFVAIAYFLVRYRRSPENQTGQYVPPRPTLDWIIAVSLFSLFSLWWVIGYYQYLDIEQAPPNAKRVYVAAKQWMWKFRDPVAGELANELVVPVGAPIELLLSSRDVIHSFYVPEFRLKQDVLPGRTTSLWFTATTAGSYQVMCAELCGLDHSRMRGMIRVLSQEDYSEWLQHQTTPDVGTMVDEGLRVAADHGCLSCHSLDGSRRVGPTWRGLYRSMEELQDGSRVFVDDAYLTRSMMQPAVDIVAGFPNVMPVFKGQLEAAEVGALIELIRALQYDGPPPARGAAEQELDKEQVGADD